MGIETTAPVSPWTQGAGIRPAVPAAVRPSVLCTSESRARLNCAERRSGFLDVNETGFALALRRRSRLGRPGLPGSGRECRPGRRRLLSRSRCAAGRAAAAGPRRPGKDPGRAQGQGGPGELLGKLVHPMHHGDAQHPAPRRGDARQALCGHRRERGRGGGPRQGGGAAARDQVPHAARQGQRGVRPLGGHPICRRATCWTGRVWSATWGADPWSGTGSRSARRSSDCSARVPRSRRLGRRDPRGAADDQGSAEAGGRPAISPTPAVSACGRWCAR